MEAHEAQERFDKVSEAEEESGGPGGHLARSAAIVVAVLAAFLAIATFLANETVKEVITDETRGADTTAQLDANDLKTIVATNDAVLFRVIGAGSPKESTAVAEASELESRVQSGLLPVDRRLSAQVAADANERSTADQRHLLYELAVVGLQVGIVVAGISILVRRRWLLTGAAAVGAAGVAVLVAGIAY